MATSNRVRPAPPCAMSMRETIVPNSLAAQRTNAKMAPDAPDNPPPGVGDSLLGDAAEANPVLDALFELARPTPGYRPPGSGYSCLDRATACANRRHYVDAVPDAADRLAAGGRDVPGATRAGDAAARFARLSAAGPKRDGQPDAGSESG